jgi:hypothetical protein
MARFTFDFRGLKRVTNGTTTKTPSLIVEISTALPANVRFRMTKFRTGVFGSARILRESTDSAIVEFQEGSNLQVFFPDGAVVSLQRKKDTDEIVVIKLTREQMAIERVNMCIRGLNLRPGDVVQRARIEDAILYQLELIYRFGTDKVRKFVMDFVYDLVDKKRVGIRRKPMENLLGTLRRHNTIHYFGLNQLIAA